MQDLSNWTSFWHFLSVCTLELSLFSWSVLKVLTQPIFYSLVVLISWLSWSVSCLVSFCLDQLSWFIVMAPSAKFQITSLTNSPSLSNIWSFKSTYKVTHKFTHYVFWLWRVVFFQSHKEGVWSHYGEATPQLKWKPSKQLGNDNFAAAVAIIERTREDRMRSVNKSIQKSIEVGLKHADRSHDKILSIVKCGMSVRDEKEKEEEREQLE